MKSTKTTKKNLLITKQDKLISFEIFQTLEEVSGIDQRMFINNRGRTRRVVMLRQISAYLMGQYTTMSLKDIGFLLGGFDHSTIIHSKELVTDWLDNPKFYPTEYSIITECQNILSEKYGQRINNAVLTPIGQD
jgi:chromosomal replication initiation ATPase DnaA